MSNKDVGVYQKYRVEKISNPAKDVDCIVLEFDDPIGRVGIRAWAQEMRKNGFESVYMDVIKKIHRYEDIETKEKK